jgi:hypothetical protein
LLQTLTSIVRVQRCSVLKTRCAASMMQLLNQRYVVHTHDLPLLVALPTPAQQHTKHLTRNL